MAEHKDEIAAADVYTKDTADYKYENYTELPVFTDKHQSLMSKLMTPELFNQMKDLKTAKGYTISNCIQTGVKTPHLGVGITAPMQETAAEETAEVLALLTPEQQEELKAVPLAQQAEVIALQRQFQGRFAAKPKAEAKARPSPGPAGGRAGGRPATPPRTGAGATSAPRCGNCGGEHPTKECTKAKLDFKDRFCFSCLKPGHRATECPNKVAAMVQQQQGTAYALCVGCEDQEGFRQVRRGGARSFGEVLSVKATGSQREKQAAQR